MTSVCASRVPFGIQHPACHSCHRRSTSFTIQCAKMAIWLKWTRLYNSKILFRRITKYADRGTVAGGAEKSIENENRNQISHFVSRTRSLANMYVRKVLFLSLHRTRVALIRRNRVYARGPYCGFESVCLSALTMKTVRVYRTERENSMRFFVFFRFLFRRF